MTKVFIDGSAGTAGLQIHQRLESRPDVDLITIPYEKRHDANERAEATKIYILLILSKTHADFLHECLYSHGDIFLGYTCLLGNFVDDFCFCHFSFAYILIM